MLHTFCNYFAFTKQARCFLVKNSGKSSVPGSMFTFANGLKPWSNGLESSRKLKTYVYLRLRLARPCVHLRWLAITLVEIKFASKSMQVFHRLATQPISLRKFNLPLLASPFDQGFSPCSIAEDRYGFLISFPYIINDLFFRRFVILIRYTGTSVTGYSRVKYHPSWLAN